MHACVGITWCKSYVPPLTALGDTSIEDLMCVSPIKLHEIDSVSRTHNQIVIRLIVETLLMCLARFAVWSNVKNQRRTKNQQCCNSQSKLIRTMRLSPCSHSIVMALLWLRLWCVQPLSHYRRSLMMVLPSASIFDCGPLDIPKKQWHYEFHLWLWECNGSASALLCVTIYNAKEWKANHMSRRWRRTIEKKVKKTGHRKTIAPKCQDEKKNPFRRDQNRPTANHQFHFHSAKRSRDTFMFIGTGENFIGMETGPK